MKPRQATRRKVARTLLLVGEGNAEENFLRHLKSIYGQRYSGVMVTIKNAHGKTALHVVDVAIRHTLNAAYDDCAVLLDTDVGWDQSTQSKARKGHVQVITSDPCLESLLLQMHQRPVQGRTTAQVKHDFAALFGTAASEPEVFHRHFAEELIAAARHRVPILDRLLKLIEPGLPGTL
jgi:RloB-like protein